MKFFGISPTAISAFFLIIALQQQQQRHACTAFVASSSRQHTTLDYRGTRPLFVVAEQASNEKASAESSWIPVSGGGYLPNFANRQSEVIVKPAVIEQVLNIQDYKKVVADEHEKIVCVRFYAAWCRSCKAVQPMFRQTAKVFSKPPYNVKFVEVPLTKDNAFLHQGLGVPSLPYGHVYHPKVGLVEERRINKKLFNQFRDTILMSYINGYCPVEWDGDELVNPISE